MSHYMRLTLPDPDTKVPEDILEERKEELESMLGIYDEKEFEEKIVDQVWIYHMDLPYLANNFSNRTACESASDDKNQPNSKINTKLKKQCQFFLKGNCRFGLQCKYSHEVLSSKPVVVKSPFEEEREKTRTKFDLVIRFPQGKYYFTFLNILLKFSKEPIEPKSELAKLFLTLLTVFPAEVSPLN